MRQVGNRYQNDIFKSKHINNHTNVNSINIPNQKAQIFRVNKRKQGNYFLPKRNPLKYKDTDRLKVKVKSWKKAYKGKKDLKKIQLSGFKESRNDCQRN